MNTHESYVSLEVAKLLKEAGFDWECEEYREKIYMPINPKDLPTLPLPYNLSCKVIEDANEKSFEIRKYPRPTLEVAQRWLREVKNIDVNIITDLDSVKRLYYVRYIVKDGHYKTYFITNNRSYVYFNTFEEAQEAGIQKCLKIILNK